MEIKTLKPGSTDFPAQLSVIPQPPKQLYAIGDNLEELWRMPKLSVIGSRRATPYGLSVTSSLIQEVAKHGVLIVSGLALGIDGAAHKAALAAGGKTVAVLGNGLNKFHPQTHDLLARDILKQGGAILSEYREGTPPLPVNFIERNRLVSGLGDALLVIEAAEKSGTLHTVNFALEQGKTVLAVPGNITSALSKSTNNLIKTGAIPVTEAKDILDALKIQESSRQTQLIADSAEEYILLKLLQDGLYDTSELLRASELATNIFNQTLTMLEISGRIKPQGAGQWVIA